MRISDWGSDVCSSDLNDRSAPAGKCFEDGRVVIQAKTRVCRARPEILDDPAMQVYEVCSGRIGNGRKSSSYLLCEGRSGDKTEQEDEPGFHAFSSMANYGLAGAISYPAGGSAPSRCRTK